MGSGKQEKSSRRVRSKSYFYKYFISLLIMLVVPMLTTALIFVHAQGVVKEQIQIASRNTLNQFFERLDDTLEEGYNICVTIANNEKCKQYPRYVNLKQGKTSYQTWEIMNLLSNYGREKYHDIFIYYPIDDRIISGTRSSLTLDLYYDIFYHDDEREFREEFRAVAESEYGKPMLCSMKGKEADSYLCIAMNYRGSRNKENSFTVVVVLDQNYVAEVLQSVEEKGQSGISMLHDEKKEVIISTDALSLSYGLEGYRENDVAFEDKVGEENCIVQVRKSGVVDAYYVYAVTYGYFWERLFSLYIICGLGALVFIAVGVFVAWEEARRVYHPVEQMVSNLQRQGADIYNDRINTEFEFIELLLGKEAKEKVAMNNAIRKGKAIKRDNFIYSLLNGSGENLTETNDIFYENGIDLYSDRFCVIVFDIEHEGILDSQRMLFVIANVYQELFERVGSGYLVSLSTGRYAILVNLKNNHGREELVSVIKEGQEFLEKFYELTATFGVSSIQEGMLGVHAAYEEACLALKYRYLLGKECTIEYDQVKEREFKYLPASEAKLLYKVSEYLFGEHLEMSVPALLDEVMNDYGIDVEASMETVECFKFETISVLNRVMMQGGYWSDQWKGMAMELLNRVTLEEFKEKLTELLSALYQKQRETVKEKDVCAQAYEYIETHYIEEQLSLNILGEIFGIAPSYLSKLFKEKYGISIPNFISQTRINSAKLSLRNTNRSIREIAEDCGFLSSSVFVKTFKKLEGITPGVYRGFFDADR